MKLDIDLSLRKNYLSKDFAKVSDKYVIMSKIRNVLLLQQSDVTYKDYLYSSLTDLIGEDLSNGLAVIMKEHIRFVIEKFVPEVTLIDIKLGLHYDTQILEIKIKYFINEDSEEVEQNISIKSRN